jgi:hypothetical protein
VESVGALSGEHPAAADLVGGLCRERRVLRGAALADVHRRARKVPRQDLLLAVPDHRERVELRSVPGLVADVGDLAGVAQERRVVAHDGVEVEPVREICGRGSLVGDVNLVTDVFAELIEVRSSVVQLHGMKLAMKVTEFGRLGLTNA